MIMGAQGIARLGRKPAEFVLTIELKRQLRAPRKALHDGDVALATCVGATAI